MDYVYVSLAVSCSINAVLAYQIIKKKHVLTVDAKKVLADLMAGPSVIRVEVLDTSGLFYRSPKG